MNLALIIYHDEPSAIFAIQESVFRDFKILPYYVRYPFQTESMNRTRFNPKPDAQGRKRVDLTHVSLCSRWINRTARFWG